MLLVLDASATLAWLINRVDPAEAQLALEILKEAKTHGAVMPSLWHTEVANGVLVAERRGGIAPATSALFLSLVETLPIEQDSSSPRATLGTVLALARIYKLTSYDATYLELALRTGGILATFDRQLADALRHAGGRVFGDPV
jgi:predicted nucleic acid-binding protein